MLVVTALIQPLPYPSRRQGHRTGTVDASTAPLSPGKRRPSDDDRATCHACGTRFASVAAFDRHLTRRSTCTDPATAGLHLTSEGAWE